jgi:hypothetical protein
LRRHGEVAAVVDHLFPEIEAMAQGGKLLLNELVNYSQLEVPLVFFQGKPPLTSPRNLPSALPTHAGTPTRNGSSTIKLNFDRDEIGAPSALIRESRTLKSRIMIALGSESPDLA